MDKKYGEVTQKPDGFQVKFERVFPFKTEVVWDAITKPEQLAKWFTDFEMDFVEGGKMIIRFRDENKTETYGKILRIDAPHYFEFSWEDELAQWEIITLGPNECKLILTYSRLSDKYALSVPTGFHVVLDQLEAVLHGASGPFPFDGQETEEGKRLYAIYSAAILKDYPALKNNDNEK